MFDVFNLAAKLTLDSSEYDKGLDSASKNATDFADSLSKMKSGAESIKAGVGIIYDLGKAVYGAADSASQNLDNIDKMSQKLGLSAKAYQEWDYVLKISGADIDSMSTGLKTLTNKFDEAVGGSASAVKTFERLGLSMEDIKDLSREDLFSAAITAFQNMEDSAERAALANDLFGRSGQELTPLFNTTAEETQNLIQQVNDLGGVLSDDAVANGAAFQDALTGVQTALSGATQSLLVELIPAITSLMQKLTEFIASGGLDTIIETLKILAPIIGVVVTAFAGFKIISGIITLIQGASAAMQALNIVFAMNPIGLVVAAVAALIAIFVTLWNNCEEFREFWINLWEGIKKAFQDTVAFFSKAFDDIADFASKTWEGIKNTFSAIGEWFHDKFSKAKENAVNAWSDVKSKFSEVWENIKSGFKLSDALTWGKDMINNFVSGITQKWDELKSSVSGVAQTVKNFLGFSEPKLGPLSDFHTYAPDMMQLFAEGIRKNEHLITDQISDSFDIGATISGARASTGTSAPTTIIVQSVLDGRVIGETAYRYGQNRLRTVGG